MIEIIEQFDVSKFGAASASEDRIVCSPHVVAVIDGASACARDSESAFQHLLNDASELLLQIGPTTQPAQLIKGLTQLFVDRRLPSRDAGLFFAAYHHHRSEIWSVGDCQYLVNGVLMTQPVAAESLVTRARQSLLTACRAMAGVCDQTCEDLERSMLRHLLTLQRRLANDENHPLGYGVVNDGHLPDKFVRITKIETDATEIVLATDGYPVLMRTLGLSEAQLSRLLTVDPLCIGENAGPKGVGTGQISYDDRAYIRFTATSQRIPVS